MTRLRWKQLAHSQYQGKLWKVLAVLSSIVVVGALTCCALPHYTCDLKAAQMNILPNLIFCVKGEGAVDRNKVTKWYKKFYSCCKNLDNQDQVGLKLWILRLYLKPLKQIQGVTLGEYQESSASHYPLWFIPFMTSAKLSRVAEFCLTWPK